MALFIVTETTLVGDNNIMHIYQPVFVCVSDVCLIDDYIYRPSVMWCDIICGKLSVHRF